MISKEHPNGCSFHIIEKFNTWFEILLFFFIVEMHKILWYKKEKGVKKIKNNEEKCKKSN